MTKIRTYFYLISGVIAALLPILTALKVIDTGQAGSITTLITSLSSLLGGGAALTAGAILSKQRKDGTVTDVPESAIDVIAANVPVVVQQAEQARNDLGRLRDVFAGAAGELPIYGPDIEKIIKDIKL